MLTKLLVLLTIHHACAREFNNPLMEVKVNIPSVTKLIDTYYVTDSFNTSVVNSSLTVFTSKDLITWEVILIDIASDPSDALTEFFYEPELHLIDGLPRLYHKKYTTVSDVAYYKTKVAYSNDIVGLYHKVTDHVLDAGTDADHPTTLAVNGSYYLIWSQFSFQNTTGIYAQPLTHDGLLGARNTTPTKLFEPTLDWEQGATICPTATQRKDYFYIFYSVIIDCRNIYGIGVARSKSPLGPYEKFPDPILISEEGIEVPKFPSVTLDVDNESFVLFFSAFQNTEDCMRTPPAYLFAKSLMWDDNDWPYIA